MQPITRMGPAAAPLAPLKAAPPTSAHDGAAAAREDTAVAAAAPSEDTAVAGQLKVNAAVLRLARELRQPRSHVGFIAFILFGLCKKCRPCCWEGSNYVELLSVYAPWALPMCPQPCAVAAIPCALVGKAGGMIECVPISEDSPLSRPSHYVAGVPIPAVAAAAPPAVPAATTIEAFYAALGVSMIPSICDGDCAFDVMNMMLGLPQRLQTREQLRIEISDYLIERMGERWMLDLLVVAQELNAEDVTHACSQALLPLSRPHPQSRPQPSLQHNPRSQRKNVKMKR